MGLKLSSGGKVMRAGGETGEAAVCHEESQPQMMAERHVRKSSPSQGARAAVAAKTSASAAA